MDCDCYSGVKLILAMNSYSITETQCSNMLENVRRWLLVVARVAIHNAWVKNRLRNLW